MCPCHTNSWNGDSAKQDSESRSTLPAPVSKSQHQWRPPDISHPKTTQCSRDVLTTTTGYLSSDKVRDDYCYDPLPKGDNVRYFILEPGREHDELVCQIMVERISRLPDFDAVSYAWGGHTKVGKMHVTNIAEPLKYQLRLTANLTELLLVLRSPNEQRYLWADQICIDQHNLRERGHQVGLMGQIYRAARKVYIWLGNDPGGAKQVASLVADLSPFSKTATDLNPLDATRRSAARDSAFNDPRWSAVSPIWSSTSFTRVWVVQEAALAREPRVLYGKVEFSWESFVYAVYWRDSYNWFHFKNSGSMRSIHLGTLSHWNPKSELEHSQQPLSQKLSRGTLLDLVNRMSHLEASDPHDYIYALLSHPLAKPINTGSLVIRPDYTITYLGAYFQFAVIMITKTKNTSILEYVRHSDSTLKEEFPSWVPRWNFGILNHVRGAGEDWQPTECHPAPHLLDHKRLKVSGVVLDEIIFASSLLDTRSLPLEANAEDPSSANAVLASWTFVSNPRNRRPYYPESDVPHAFMATLGQALLDQAPPWDIAAYLLHIIETCPAGPPLASLPALRQAAKGGSVADAGMFLFTICGGAAFACTARGCFGLAPRCARAGDVFAVVDGCPAPLVLRPMPMQEGEGEGEVGECCFRVVGVGFMRRVEKEKEKGKGKDGWRVLGQLEREGGLGGEIILV